MLDPAHHHFATGRNAFLAGDLRTARKQYKAAVKCGSVAAIHNLGIMLLHGQGCIVNYSLARDYFEEAALHGVTESMNQLGYMYYYGKGCPQDFAMARGWLLSSDMHGSHFYAQYHLGMIHALGQGVPQNWREAAKWLQMSADQGYCPAIYNLGVLYFNGDGVPQNFDRALELYAKAAVNGHAEGNNNFAVMCAEGLGTWKHDAREILQFFERAAARNMSAAHYNLVNVHLSEPVVLKRDPLPQSPTSRAYKGLPAKKWAQPPQTKKSHPLPLPNLPERTSSKKTVVIPPPSPFFHERQEFGSRVGTLPRSPTEPDFKEITSTLAHSHSAMTIRPAPQTKSAALPTPDQSPVVKVRSYSTIASRRKVPVADLARLPPTPI